MSQKRKQFDRIDKQLEAYIDEYVRETGDNQWTIPKISEWIVDTNRGGLSRETAIRSIRRRLRKVAGRTTFIDPDTKKRIRKYHPRRLGDDQPWLWSEMADIGGPENMRDSVKVRRQNIAARVFQAVDDVDYYNRKHNPGDPIQFDPDFTNDVQEREEPSLYDDTPPDADGTEGSDS